MYRLHVGMPLDTQYIAEDGKEVVAKPRKEKRKSDSDDQVCYCIIIIHYYMNSSSIITYTLRVHDIDVNYIYIANNPF